MGRFFTLLIVGSDLHHGGGAVEMYGGQAIGFAQTGIAAEDVGAAVLTAEDGALGKHSQPVKGGRPGITHHRVGQNSIVEGHVNAVVVPVEGHGLHVDVGVQQLRAADLGIGGGVQQLLAAGGQVDPQVLNAVLIPTGVGDLPGVDGHGLLQVLGIAAQGVLAFLGHRYPSIRTVV